MKTMTVNLTEVWPELAACLVAGPNPWPNAVIELDWQWWQAQKAAGKIRAMPGRHTLARRWHLRENRVRIFLQARQQEVKS